LKPIQFLAVVLLLAVLALGAGWWLGRTVEAASGGQLAVEWLGSRNGKAVLPAQIAWCPITRVGTLEAISRDTGMIVTLLEPDTLSSGSRHVVSNEIREQSPRPNALAAIRWVSDSGMPEGFRSVSGTVDLRAANAQASGSFEIRMRAQRGTDTLVVRGRFSGVAITAGAVGCP
jgi:hypothetical protein